MLQMKLCQFHVQNVVFVTLANAVNIKELLNSCVSRMHFAKPQHFFNIMFISLLIFPTAPHTHMIITDVIVTAKAEGLAESSPHGRHHRLQNRGVSQPHRWKQFTVVCVACCKAATLKCTACQTLQFVVRP